MKLEVNQRASAQHTIIEGEGERDEMVAVRGILLNELVLFAEDDEGNVGFQSGAEALLRRLKYSNLRVGIFYAAGVSTQKMTILKRTATLYLLDCFTWNASSVNDVINEILLSWGDIGGSCFYVTTCEDEDFTLKISNHGWLPVIKRTEGVSTAENLNLLHINKLEELPFTICRFNRKGTCSGVVTVGYIMKPSREEDFAKRGAFPLYPTQNGLIFVPLTFNLPLESQMQEVDVVLHKATDEIVTIELSTSSDIPNKISYSKGMQELERYLQHHPNCCVIDPLNYIYPVLDRLRIQELLLGLEDVNKEGRCKIRAPHFMKVDNFNEANLGERLLEAKLHFPSIVKPQVACGVADAHSMAIAFRTEDFEDLSVPLPAVIQEYVDHSSLLFKFYVLGEKVFHAVKKSTPNADVLFSSYERNGLKPIMFDSLKSLPIAKEDEQCGDEVSSKRIKDNKHSLDLGLVTDAANCLKRTLDLTIFGFDVVIQESSGDHVIVDVNYLPSFKELPNDVAIPTFWDAVRDSYESRKGKLRKDLIP